MINIMVVLASVFIGHQETMNPKRKRYKTIHHPTSNGGVFLLPACSRSRWLQVASDKLHLGGNMHLFTSYHGFPPPDFIGA